MIIDAHLHVWRSDPAYPDPSATTVSPTSDIPVELLGQYMAEHGVERAVIVQPIYPGEDNTYVADCAGARPDRFAAVCVVDPRHDGAVSRLRYWVEERGCRGLRLRPRVPREAACFGDPSTFPLWDYAAEANVIVSILGDFPHLPKLSELARRFPAVRIVVDHLAYPPNVDPRACEPLLALAQSPNVFLKISGFPYFAGEAYPYLNCRPLIRAIRDRFGPSRMIWGSDFPHVLLQSGYARALHWLERHCEFLTAADRELILGDNARSLYWAGALTDPPA